MISGKACSRILFASYIVLFPHRRQISVNLMLVLYRPSVGPVRSFTLVIIIEMYRFKLCTHAIAFFIKILYRKRPSASVFPPTHLIITRNAHGAEEGEGLGTRLVLGRCVCLSVCLSVYDYALQATRWLMSDINSFSATRARKITWQFC